MTIQDPEVGMFQWGILDNYGDHRNLYMYNSQTCMCISFYSFELQIRKALDTCLVGSKPAPRTTFNISDWRKMY